LFTQEKHLSTRRRVKNDEKSHILLKNSVQIEWLHSTEINDGQENTWKDMEADGQSGEVMSTEQNEFEEFSAIHSRHPTRYLSATAFDLFEIRRTNARPPFKRAF
jgi:hypothetical protein